MGTPVEITIRANGANQVVAEFERVKASLSSFTSGLGGLAGTFGTVAGALGIGGFALATVGAIRAGMEYNTTLERQTIAFKTLLGSMEAAERRMEDLSDFAASTPFELPEVVAASRLLQTLTDGALASGDSLRLVGDAAAASGRSFEETAMWIGRLYAGLKSGTPVGEATMRLMEMGLISGDTKRSLEELAKSGDATGRAMEVVRDTFSRTSGAMAEQAETMKGLMSTFKDAMIAFAADAVLPAWEKLKVLIRDILEMMGQVPSLSDSVALSSVNTQNAIIAASKAGTEQERVANIEKLRAQQQEYNRELEKTTDRLTQVNRTFESLQKSPSLEHYMAKGDVAKEQEVLMARETSLRQEINATEAAIKRLESAAAKASAAAGTAAVDVEVKRRTEIENMGIFGPGNVEGEADFKHRKSLDLGEFGPGNREGENKMEEVRINAQQKLDDDAIRMQQAINDEMERQSDLESEIAEKMAQRNDVAYQMRQHVEALSTPAENFASLLVGTVQSAMNSVGYALSGLIQGTITWQQALRNVGSTILTTVIQAIIRMFTEWVLRRLFASQVEVQANTTEAASKAPNALMESITSYGLAAILGVAAFVAAMALSGGFAEGGRPPVGRPALVGEEGPELFIPDRAGTVIPNDITNALATLAPTDVGFGQTTGGESSPTRIIIVDDRNSVDSLRRDPRFRNLVLDMMEERA